MSRYLSSEAKGEGQLFIKRPHGLYSPENHDAWRKHVCPHAPALGSVRERGISLRASIYCAWIRTAFRASKM